MRRVFRSTIVHCLGDPGADARSLEVIEDGLLVVEDGIVLEVGPADSFDPPPGEGTETTDLSGKLLLPGLIDCHVHYPQIDMMASYGAQLLDWLERYAYPEEAKFADEAHARRVADRFAEALLANGTTTALVFATVHPHSAGAMFAAAQARNMRLVTGKVAMDCHCPEALRDTPETAYADSRELIERWHGVDRLGYALTPRFALTSSPAQLEALGSLAAEFPDVHIHTHLAENADETAAVRSRYADCRSYLDAYACHGLLRRRAVFAHCLHLDEADWRQLADGRGSIAFCPSSNLFLGSGLFDLAAADAHDVATGIGSDVGGGTSLNLLRTLADGYKALQLNGQNLDAGKALYLATLGAARALDLDDRIGNFTPGKEADFVVLDPLPDAPAGRRAASASSLEERLFAVIMLGDDRDVYGTWLMGEPAWRR